MNMLQLLIKACPEAAFIKDKLQRLPLHFAAMSIATSCLSVDLQELTGRLVAHSSKAPACTVSVIQLLIETNKNAVLAVDYEGRTPLHNLCMYMSAHDDDNVSMELLGVLELLVRADASVAKLSDKHGNVPIAILENMYQRLQNDESGASTEQRKDQRESLESIISLCGKGSEN